MACPAAAAAPWKSRPHSPRPADRPAVSPLPPRTRTCDTRRGPPRCGPSLPAPAGGYRDPSRSRSGYAATVPHPCPRAPERSPITTRAQWRLRARPPPGARQTLAPPRQLQQPHGLIGSRGHGLEPPALPSMSEGRSPASYSMKRVSLSSCPKKRSSTAASSTPAIRIISLLSCLVVLPTTTIKTTPSGVVSIKTIWLTPRPRPDQAFAGRLGRATTSTCIARGKSPSDDQAFAGRLRRATASTCMECGNMSTGCTSSSTKPCLTSQADPGQGLGLQET